MFLRVRSYRRQLAGDRHTARAGIEAALATYSDVVVTRKHSPRELRYFCIDSTWVTSRHRPGRGRPLVETRVSVVEHQGGSMALVSLHVEFGMVIMIILGAVVLSCLTVMIAREALRPSASLLSALAVR